MSRPERRFWFSLALALGKSVAETMACVSSREFTEWMIFDQIEPIGGRRMDLNFANVCLTIARANGAKNLKLEDFRLQWGTPKKQRRVSNREIMASIKAVMKK